MLAELLKLLNTGGLHATGEVARRLEVSEMLVAEMAEGLARRGYLALVGGDAGECTSGGCSGCLVASTCGKGGRGQPQIMVLTEKGRRAVRGL